MGTMKSIDKYIYFMQKLVWWLSSDMSHRIDDSAHKPALIKDTDFMVDTNYYLAP